MSIVLFILVGVLCLATPAVAIEGSAFLRQADANLQPESFESYRELINIEPSGAQREFLLSTLNKGQVDRRCFSPQRAKQGGRPSGWGDTMWLYIPTVAKPIRITSLQSVVGGVFNNADILRLDYKCQFRRGAP